MAETQLTSQTQLGLVGFEAKAAHAQEDGSGTLLARVRDVAGTYITQSGISTITWDLFDLSSATPTTAVLSAQSLTVANVVFDSLTRDERWQVDDVGYNFRATLATTVFSVGDHLYLWEGKFTNSSSEVFFGAVNVYASPISTS